MTGHDMIKETAESVPGVQILQLGPAFQAALSRGEQPYRDFLHPSATGQAIIARELADAILNPPPATAPIVR